MRCFYVFRKDHALSGWMQLDGVWTSRQDAYDCMNFDGRSNPDSQYLIGYDNDKGILTIPDNFNDIPTS